MQDHKLVLKRKEPAIHGAFAGPVSDTRMERIVARDGSVKDPGHAGPRPGEPPEGEYMTVRELANWLRISRGSAWALVFERGEIPHLRIGERMVRLSRADVEEYIRRCRSDSR